MKLRHVTLLIIILATIPLLAACDLLGIGNSGNSEREEYERKIEIIRQAMEDQQKALQEYNEKLKEGLEEYYEKFEEYQQQQQEQQPGIDITVSVNQTSDNGSGGAD